MTRTALIAVFLSATATSAIAQDTGLRFGLGVSTVGGTLEGAYRFNQNFALRGIVAGGVNASTTETAGGVNYDVSGQLGGFALMGDYYTGNSGFRISGGAFVSNVEFNGNAVASAANPITVGNTTLNAGERADVDVQFRNRVSPILTIGYDQKIGRNFTISGEIGAIAMGGLDATITTNVAVPAADLAAETQSIQNDLNGIGNLYPYIGITASFRF